jgi:hypothetical protein
MSIRSFGIAAMAASLLVSSAFAQDIEPNQTKAEATTNGTTALSAGGTITGTSTGATATTGSTLLTTVDTYRIRTGALPLGIYQHRLTLTSPVVGHTGTIRGWNQSGTNPVGGTVGTVDTAIQTTITSAVLPRTVQWYGFGKQEELFYRVSGTATTTAAYTATMSTATVTPNVIAPAFEASGPITISTGGQTAVDTELLLYDSAFNLVAQNDNNSASSQSTITTTLAPGTYYLAVSVFELCISQTSPPITEFFFNGWLTDFPDCVVLSDISLLTADWDFQVRACNGTHTQPNLRPANTPFAPTWYQITAANGAPMISSPANDNCASAMSFSASGSHVTSLGSATNDGTASCDPGGAASKDVWYSFNAGPGGGTLDINTCGTTVDTCLSVHNSCGGADVLCSDDCGGAPCAGPGSCLAGLVLAPSQVILVRLSDKGLGGCGDVTTTFTYTANPPTNDGCTTPIVLPNGFGTFVVSNFLATTGVEGQIEPLCNQVGGTAVRQDVWYTWTPTNSGTTEITTCGLLTPGGGSQDTKIAVYAGTGCPVSGSAIACNDDDPGGCGGFATKLTFNAVCGTTYTIQFGMYQGTAATYTGGLMISGTGPTCSTPATPECIGDTVAACPCSGAGGSLVPNAGAPGNGCANNTFVNGANLSSTGIAVDNAGDTLVLTCAGMPGPGLFFQSNALAGPFVNFNDGILCAAVGIIRMGVVFPDGGGNASYPGGLTPNPIHIAGAPVLAPNPTKHYQCWYRDITPGFCNPQGHNMSNGIALTWAP